MGHIDWDDASLASEDEHVRWSRYRQIAIEAGRDEAVAGELLQRLPADPDQSMVSAVAVELVTATANHLARHEDLASWAARHGDALRAYPFAAARCDEWLVRKSIDKGGDPADLRGAGDWLQRSVAECSTSATALALLAVEGNTRSIRRTAAARGR
ncbi:hypothetical protein [Paraconexibacter sp. AEG42_29]|uniref:hypothetical protein n=1 Tax=Paraconexibacter sp. AEG42_29 TaxID=2997339 RepID=UPI00339D4B6F